MAENQDADVLYWVGCMGSFDRRNQQVATSVAKILKASKVNFAILGPEETCTGDPARRIGNEYLWQMQAQQNIETLNGYGFNTSSTATTAEAQNTAGMNGASSSNCDCYNCCTSRNQTSYHHYRLPTLLQYYQK